MSGSKRSRQRALGAWVLWVTLVGVVSAVAAATGVEEGQKAPDFSASKLDGGTLRLDELRGKVVLVDFWASWCKPCSEALPAFEKLRAKYGKQGLVVVGVNIDDERQRAVAFLKDVPVTFPVLYDAGKKIVSAYGPPTMPSSYLIDRSGMVRHVHAGFRSSDAKVIEKEVAALLR